MTQFDEQHPARRYTRRQAIARGASAAAAAGVAGLALPEASAARRAAPRVPAADARLIASGIPAASAVAPVGTFLPGGPIHDNPVLAAFTQPGRVLDPTRILVGSRSNFGAPIANADQAPGALLSIAPGAAALAVPPGFAAAGDQASTLGGAVQLYSAQSPAFRNAFYNPAAVTAAQTAVSDPLALSINNAFGRLWPANAPYGLAGPGSSTIDDPDGRPLKGAPNPVTGGVYFGDLTGRLPAQVIPGALRAAAVGTAFLGRSPDGSGRAVFCVIVADGSIVQEHTGKGLDGLAPAGTVAPLLGRSRGGHDLRAHGREGDNRQGDNGNDENRNDENGNDREDRDRRPTPRLGAVVNYTPAIVLYVSQPGEDSILAIDLQVGGAPGDQVFVPVGVHVLRSRAFDRPVDLAPVHVETEDPNWSSNTTLEEGSDLYVCNAGNATIARVRQDGSTVAVRRVGLGGHGRGRGGGHELGGARLNGIATAPDAKRIWVTYTGTLAGTGGREGGVLELAAF